MVTLVTAFIIITIGSNLVLSLGMVGALSIVRFRAAVKDPLDVGFLFWGVAAGLTAGAGLYSAALFSTALIAVIYMGFGLLRVSNNVFLLILRYDAAFDETICKLLAENRCRVKNKTTQGAETEITAEIKTRKKDSAALNGFASAEGVKSASFVEYTGDFM